MRESVSEEEPNSEIEITVISHPVKPCRVQDQTGLNPDELPFFPKFLEENEYFRFTDRSVCMIFRQMRKPNAKERILETAGKLFHQRGYSEVGINEIIEKAETAKASFYQHYPSKEALCEAWLASVHDRSKIGRTEILEKEIPPSEKVRLYFDHLEQFMSQSEYRGCPYSNTSAVSDEACTGIVAQIRSHKESLRRFFHEISSQKFADSEEARRIGDRLFLLYSGATTESQNLKSLWPIQEARAGAIELLS